MNQWIDRLKTEKRPDTHATKPTKPPQGVEKGGFVGFVAYPPGPFQNFNANAAGDVTAPNGGFRRFCSVPAPAFSEIQAPTAPARDPFDTRVTCTACRWLVSNGGRCTNYRAAGLTTPHVGAIVSMPQHCPGHASKAPPATGPPTSASG